MVLGCTSLTCFKCGGRGEINCADLYRFHFFRIAQIKFGVACSTPENEEPIEMCYKQPATDQSNYNIYTQLAPNELQCVIIIMNLWIS